jgi:hypothetical protein
VGEEQVKRQSAKRKWQSHGSAKRKWPSHGKDCNDPRKSFLGIYFCILRFAICLLTCSSVFALWLAPSRADFNTEAQLTTAHCRLPTAY